MSAYRLRTSKVKGLRMIDAKEMAELHPSTFEVPSEDSLSRVKYGDFIKVAFEDADGIGERIWLCVVGEFRGHWIGALANKPALVNLSSSECYLVLPWHVYDIQWGADLVRPAPRQ
jgi:hypothetical protein